MARLFHGIRRLEEWLIASAVLIVAALLIGNVICRSLLGFSLAATEELSQFLIILITFFGLSYAAGMGRHIRMTALYDLLGHQARKSLMIFIAGSTCLLMLLLAVYAARYVDMVWMLGTSSPVLRVPYAVVYAIVPLGLFLTAIQYGLTVVQNLRSDDVYLSFDRKDEYEQPTSSV